VSRLERPLSELLAADHGDWQGLLRSWQHSPAGRRLIEAVDQRVASGATVYPAQVFRALQLTSLSQTKVLILGQDPYHGPGQAEGLAFSVPEGVPVPPSLRNVLREMQRDLGLGPSPKRSLLPWAQRGALLLNASLTVEDALPGAHAKLGWHALTDAICQDLWNDPAPKVFMLWGAHAQGRLAAIATGSPSPHRVLRSNHPSPLSAARPPRPFVGCGHFGAASDFLREAGRGGFDWALAEPKPVL
jgi:uracil-DNA glycosylase